MRIFQTNFIPIFIAFHRWLWCNIIVHKCWNFLEHCAVCAFKIMQNWVVILTNLRSEIHHEHPPPITTYNLTPKHHTTFTFLMSYEGRFFYQKPPSLFSVWHSQDGKEKRWFKNQFPLQMFVKCRLSSQFQIFCYLILGHDISCFLPELVFLPQDYFFLTLNIGHRLVRKSSTFLSKTCTRISNKFLCYLLNIFFFQFPSS